MTGSLPTARRGETPRSVREAITAAMPELTRSEKRAAHVLLADYPMLGLESISTFAERAKVSTATLQRLVSKLGYPSYPQFRTALRADLKAVRESPLTMPRGAGTDGRIAHLRNSMVDALTSTFNAIDPSELDAVVALLRDVKRTIFLAGGTFTHCVAAHLHFHLRKIRPGVVLLEQDMPRRVDQFLDASRRDVLVAFDIRRYQPDMRLTADMAASRGASIVLITDQWLSDVTHVADHTFRCRVDAATPWDTIVGLVGLTETIAASLDAELWPQSRRRLGNMDALRDRTFVPDWDGGRD
ncbi:MAG: MurR/RpiR family transcriptional regulator [Pseudomonadota bacterium]